MLNQKISWETNKWTLKAITTNNEVIFEAPNYLGINEVVLFEEFIFNYTKIGEYNLIIDCNKTLYITSSFFRLVLKIYRALEKTNKTLTLSNISRNTLEVLKWLGIKELGNIKIVPKE